MGSSTQVVERERKLVSLFKAKSSLSLSQVLLVDGFVRPLEALFICVCVFLACGIYTCTCMYDVQVFSYSEWYSCGTAGIILDDDDIFAHFPPTSPHYFKSLVSEL